MNKITFLTEMNFEGMISSGHTNMRTEFAWMCSLGATHMPIYKFNEIKNQDVVFIIFPKGDIVLNTVGVKLKECVNNFKNLFEYNFVEVLKINNKKVFFIQEGPSWFFNEYEITNQINFYNSLLSSDGVFVHNEHDHSFYKGILDKQVFTIPTLLIEDLLLDIKNEKQDKTIIGGNFCRWYGGFQSFIVAQSFNNKIFVPTSHAATPAEFQIPELTHLSRLSWIDWMKELSTFKYAVHLMPTIAAGTFNLNCAYFGIPCIGNEKVDTQRTCHPNLSIDVEDVDAAKKLAVKLYSDIDFYNECSHQAKKNYTYFSKSNFLNKMYFHINAQ